MDTKLNKRESYEKNLVDFVVFIVTVHSALPTLPAKSVFVFHFPNRYSSVNRTVLEEKFFIDSEPKNRFEG